MERRPLGNRRDPPAPGGVSPTGRGCLQSTSSHSESENSGSWWPGFSSGPLRSSRMPFRCQPVGSFASKLTELREGQKKPL